MIINYFSRLAYTKNLHLILIYSKSINFDIDLDFINNIVALVYIKNCYHILLVFLWHLSVLLLVVSKYDIIYILLFAKVTMHISDSRPRLYHIAEFAVRIIESRPKTQSYLLVI